MFQIPLIATQPTVHRETILQKNGTFTALELKLNMIIQKEIEAILSWLGVILGRQRRNDYRPKDTDLAVVMSATAASVRFIHECFFSIKWSF
jgi:hypothetical protein